jgi:hypothetical protein
MAKKAAKRSRKRSSGAKKKRSARRRAGATFDPSTAVAQFFDRVDRDPDIQAEIAANNLKLVDIAEKYGFRFSYADMAEHLRARWCIECGPNEHYCCF